MFEFRSRPGLRVGGLVVTGVVAITAGLGIAVGSAVRVFDHAPPLRVTVQQRGEYVSPTSTLGDAVSQFHLAARAGNLLDVQGQLLKPKVYPGQVLLDGREA